MSSSTTSETVGRNNVTRRVEVVPYDPHWPELYQVEAERVASVFGKALVALHHIGSTAIPQMAAKPIIDVLAEVNDLRAIDELEEPMLRLGFIPKGEYGIPGRRFFIKGEETDHTHHLHVFRNGDPQVLRHLAFRDYLVAHPDQARQYASLKAALAHAHPADIDRYMDGKDAFIKEIDGKALAWRNSSPSTIRL